MGQVAGLAELLALTPNAAGMIDYGLPRGYRRFTLVCQETEHPDHFAHLRHFAPANGIPEDPVTGSGHTQLVPYWAERLGKTTFHARQVSQRGGDLWCELQGELVMISGYAVTYLRGEIEC